MIYQCLLTNLTFLYYVSADSSNKWIKQFPGAFAAFSTWSCSRFHRTSCLDDCAKLLVWEEKRWTDFLFLIHCKFMFRFQKKTNVNYITFYGFGVQNKDKLSVIPFQHLKSIKCLVLLYNLLRSILSSSFLVDWFVTFYLHQLKGVKLNSCRSADQLSSLFVELQHKDQWASVGQFAVRKQSAVSLAGWLRPASSSSSSSAASCSVCDKTAAFFWAWK